MSYTTIGDFIVGGLQTHFTGAAQPVHLNQSWVLAFNGIYSMASKSELNLCPPKMDAALGVGVSTRMSDLQPSTCNSAYVKFVLHS